MAKVLIIGGAGYVGSAINSYLIDHHHYTWVLDNFSTGHHELVLGNGLTTCDAGDYNFVSKLLSTQKFDCVMHFAAKSIVSESVKNPELYFENNVAQTERLLKAITNAGVKHFIFSSTCAIFGDPGLSCISESTPKKPINPYGESKLQAERIIENFCKTKGLNAVCLRYFNAAGADPVTRVGEWHTNETHLIPRIFHACNTDKNASVFGKDYPTKDGTCIRDYIHVHDLAQAHMTAMNSLISSNQTHQFKTYNIGSESGYSVLEVISEIERSSNTKFNILYLERREGDPSLLVADSTLAKKELGFKINFNLKSIIQTAWKWEEKLLKIKNEK